MTAAELATGADVERVLARLAELERKLDALANALPPPLQPLKQTAQRYGLDARTLQTRHPEAIVRVGRRVLIDTSKLASAASAEGRKSA